MLMYVDYVLIREYAHACLLGNLIEAREKLEIVIYIS